MALALLGQGVVSSVHNDSLNPHDARDVARHAEGRCGHAPGQSHSDPRGDDCCICAILFVHSQGLPDAAPLIAGFEQVILERAARPPLAIPFLSIDAAPADDPRGPPATI